MKVVVVHSWARDVSAATVRSDGSVDWRNARMTAGEDDPAALACALQIARAAGGEVVGLTIGDSDASWALARGVGRTVAVPDAPALRDNAATAAVLAAAVRRIGEVDAVVIGDCQQDPGVGVALAGHLGWPVLAGLASATAEDGHLVAARGGTEEVTFRVAPPAVLGIAAAADVDRPPGMKELLAARRRPVTRWTLRELHVDVHDLHSEGTRRPASTPARLLRGEPAEVARQLVAALRAEGVL